MKIDWTLTAECLEKFLAWLSPDREEAVRKFQQLEKKLIVFFSRAGCHVPEELFDKTIDIACRKIASDEVEQSVNPTAFCCGVARNVLHEYRRVPKPGPMPDDFSAAHKPPAWSDQEVECMEACLGRLGERQRVLVMRFHEHVGGDKIRVRRELAAQEGGSNALRVKVFRIRSKLRDCVVGCINQKGTLAQ